MQILDLVWSPELFIGAIACAGFYYRIWETVETRFHNWYELKLVASYFGGWSQGKVRLYTRDKANYWTKYNVDRNILLLSPLFIYSLFIYFFIIFFTAFTGTFQGVIDVICEWGSLFVITMENKVIFFGGCFFIIIFLVIFLSLRIWNILPCLVVVDARAVNCWCISICGSMVASQFVCSTLDQTVRVQALLICGIVFCSWARHFTHSVPLITQGQIVQKVDNTVQRIAWFVLFC